MLNILRHTICALLLIASSPLSAQSTAPSAAILDRSQTVSTHQSVDPIIEHPDGTLSVGVREPSIRFSFDSQPEPEQELIRSVIDRSIDEGRAVTIGYNPDAGRFDSYSFSVVFPICAIGFGENLHSIAAPCLPTIDIDSTTPQASAHDLIARSVGLSEARRFTLARAALDEAFTRDDIEPDIAFIGHRARGIVLRMLSYDHPLNSPQADALLIAALPDLRASLAYDAVDSFLSIANVIEALGAYDEALRIYEALPQRSPLWQLQRAARIAGIRRLYGAYEEALRLLREVQLASPTAAAGMRLRFNIANTLMDMGRFEESISEISTGLMTQPDFAWGILLRSCARASLGDIEGALADEQRGYAAFLQYPEEELAAADDSQARIEARLALLERLATEAPHVPAPGTCNDGPGNERRERSPLLNGIDLQIADILRLEQSPPEE